ncbi:MAG: toprim domain-containing protein [Sphingobacteriales bacterium]|uniref:CHC2 zinc finger domain-containing protein n=1 Tax=uncultured Dysgonomonas sp. TaxID=206096 RepID=UPI001AC439C2|nr:CHC2 zinc finger domain-containing protein [uncultured Dysgonomonas sp.]MBN8857118.1 toprim domain-containing protein [Sphingobacteriales bacterium]
MATQMIFEEAKKVELIDLLASLGFTPDRIARQDYWYKSPFRNERTASLKVNRDRNIYYDHGEGKGGNVIDFTVRFFRCDVQEAVKKLLERRETNRFSFHQQHNITRQAGEKKDPGAGAIVITNRRSLQNNLLLSYLEHRKIPLEIAQRYCKEVDFLLYGRQQPVIGFENRSGGFELRSPTFKGSSSPKDITFLDNGRRDIYVFEGFFDFLSFAVIRPQTGSGLTNCLVLNSLSFLEKSRSLMEQHNKIFLFLDRDLSGRQSTQKALSWNQEMASAKYADGSDLYKYRDDLNAWLVAQSEQRKQPEHQRIYRGRGI